MARKRFQCSECSDGMTAFDTEEGLLSHKWSMIKATKRKSHMCCHVCKLDHRTFEGLVRHYQINHPAKQNLNCPGCNELFGRLYQLMGHLERDECPSIMVESVWQNRMLQVHATNMLAAATDSLESPMQRIEGSTQTIKDMQRIHNQRERHMDVLRDRLLEDEADRAAESERPNFSYSGVTLGDFGAFINIQPKMAKAMADAVAVQDEAYARLTTDQQCLLQDAESAASSRVPPTSAEAVDEMLRRQRELGSTSKEDGTAQDTKKASANITGSRADVVDTTGRGQKPATKHGAPPASGMGANANADAASTRQSTREFRQGDSKGPDLLTDDTSPAAQRLKNTVWAGQESMDMHDGGVRGTPSRAGAPAFGTAAPGPRTRTGSAAAPSMAKSSIAGDDSVPFDFNHPNHPRFDVNKYRDQFSGRYSCPHEICQRSGKQYKTSRAIIGHLLSAGAHTTQLQQCPSCFKWFASLNALTQHIESPTTHCHFRETDEFVPFINILSAGVADVQGHNADMTLAYSVQPTAAAALLEGLQPTKNDDEFTVW
ncbi:dhhc zinc finger membrane protein [Ophiostoma piceae UAMH 11346]|uniref:Dhhc zinc finger membrane protein n=1 Tax=Ophiostoma piceae (strain UAMH 11346) TaxID=1262450 RepID=S3BSM6_OPHP1|nr:dhhc zinc finger membrane protein [Ophiostoma piceae UAMH 11346]